MPRLLAPGLVAILLFGTAPAHADTPSYQANTAHDGAVSDPALTTPLTSAWSHGLGATPSYPVVADGRVFTLAAETVFAIDLATGRRLWERGMDVSEGSLAFRGGRLFVTSNGQLVNALDPATGEIEWMTRLESDDGNGTLTMPVPASGGRVFTSSWNYPMAIAEATGALLWPERIGEVSPSAFDGDRVYASGWYDETALAADTGEELWTRFINNRDAPRLDWDIAHTGRMWTRTKRVLDGETGATLRTFSSTEVPAFAGPLVILAADGGLVAEDELTGARRWTRPLDGGAASPPLVVSGTVFVATGAGRIEALDAATGAPQGGADLGAAFADSYLAGLGAGDGVLVVPVENGLVALRGAGATPGTPRSGPARPPFTPDPVAPGPGEATSFQQNPAHTGSLATETPAAPLRKRWAVDVRWPGHALIADGKVFATSSVPLRLMAFDQRDGRVLWSTPLRGGSELAYDGGRVFINEASRLTAFDASTGTVLWKTPEGVDGAPIAFGGTVYATVEEQSTGVHSITAFSAGNGTVQWATKGIGTLVSDGRTIWATKGCIGWTGVDLATQQTIDAESMECKSDGEWAAMSGGRLAHQAASQVISAADARPVDALATRTIPALAHGLRFALGASGLEASPAAGGVRRWRFDGGGELRSPLETYPVAGPPLVVGRQVFIASLAGRLFAVDADTGTQIEALELDDTVLFYPRLAAGGGLLIVPTENRLTAYESASGPTPTPTATPVATVTPEPTAPATATATPIPTATAEPTATPAPEPRATVVPSPLAEAYPTLYPFRGANESGVAGPPAPTVQTSPATLRQAIRTALRTGAPLRFSYRAVRRGTLTVTAGSRSTRIVFKRPATRSFSLPSRTSRQAVVKVRFRR